MRRNSISSDANSDSSMSSAFSTTSSADLCDSTTTPSNSKQFFTNLVQKTRSQVEQKTSEINATMQEKLPEWKQRGAMYSNKAKETGMEWSRRGKEAVDRWKKDRAEENNASNSSNLTSRKPHPQSENAVFGMPLEVAVALTKIDPDDLIPAVFRRCMEYLNGVGKIHFYIEMNTHLMLNNAQIGFLEVQLQSINYGQSLMMLIELIGSDIDFNVTQPDPHAVGTLLKMYLRELPEPIIPPELDREYSQQFFHSFKSSDEGDRKAMEDMINVTAYLCTMENRALPPISPDLLKTMRSITSKLPIYSFCLLQLLCKHLKNVADHEAENRMSISNLAVIFIPTLNIGRALFHCMVEHYHEIFEGVKKTKTPPPLPQKPRNLSISDQHGTATPSLPLTNPSRRMFHAKTMSDTNAMTVSSASASIKIPPPKPSRSPATSICNQQQHQTSRPPRVPPVKPRSKSVSSPRLLAHQQLKQLQNNKQDQINDEEAFWTQSGRVEAIGKQFETWMNSSITTTSPSSSSASSSSFRN
ncbi:hypothetical protein [Parasitella parasitica]|uniref:Rho-GAP domain-containing protein n=1 Tax=Parasitella parasitica TaxID=35722 RepID=A0A0B7NKW1_9FUNG|nr:hypothetical protein [Parasitella parasitica]